MLDTLQHLRDTIKSDAPAQKALDDFERLWEAELIEFEPGPIKELAMCNRCMACVRVLPHNLDDHKLWHRNLSVSIYMVQATMMEMLSDGD